MLSEATAQAIDEALAVLPKRKKHATWYNVWAQGTVQDHAPALSRKRERMKRVFPKQKAALTRAKKKGYAAVLATCTATVKEWDAIGAWPDDWATWNIALGDAANTQAHATGEWPKITNMDQIYY